MGVLNSRRVDMKMLNEYFRLNDELKIERKNKASGRWRVLNIKHINSNGYYHVMLGGEPFPYHRLLWCLYYNEDVPINMTIDHIDCNKLNNSIANLRLATSSQNNQNKKPCENKKYSQLKGVCYDLKRKKYTAEIKLNKRKIKLGRFSNENDAHEAYCRASKKYHGEFGRTE